MPEPTRGPGNPNILDAGKATRWKPGQSGNLSGKSSEAGRIKATFLEAFDQNGGVDRLVAWIKESKKNESDFFHLIVPLLPKEIKAN